MKKSTMLDRLHVDDVVHKRASRRSKAVKEQAGDWAVLLRKRLSERLAEQDITEQVKQAAALCDITGRAYQTTRRWVDDEEPGLPDLTSFKRICEGRIDALHVCLPAMPIGTSTKWIWPDSAWRLADATVPSS